MKKIIIAIAITLTIGVYMFTLSNKPMTFHNVAALNKYIAEHTPCEIKQPKISEVVAARMPKTTEGIQMSNGVIEKAEWKDINLSNSNIEDTIIKNSSFTDMNFSNSTFKNVIFKNVKFISTAPQGSLLLDTMWLDKSHFKNVKLINCTFKGEVKARKLIDSDIEFDKSNINGLDFAESKIKLLTQDSILTDVDFDQAKDGSTFTAKGGELNDIDLSDSNLNELTLNDITNGDVYYNGGITNKIEVNNSKLSLSVSGTSFNTLNINGGEINDFSAGDPKTKGFVYDNISIKNCANIEDLGLIEMKIKNLIITNSKLKDVFISNTTINKLKMHDLNIKGDNWYNKSQISQATIDHVDFYGKTRFTHLFLAELYTKNTHNYSPAKTSIENSNIEFTGHGLRLKDIRHQVTKDGFVYFKNHDAHADK